MPQGRTIRLNALNAGDTTCTALTVHPHNSANRPLAINNLCSTHRQRQGLQQQDAAKQNRPEQALQRQDT